MSIDMVQRFIVQLDSRELLDEYLRLALATVLPSCQEVAVKVMDRSVEYYSLHVPSALMDENKHFPVILIGGWYAPDSGKKNSYFNGYGPWELFSDDRKVKNAIDHPSLGYVRELLDNNLSSWSGQFTDKFGDGFNGSFNHFDGSIGIGYELRSCNSFPEILAISLVHIYYGK